MLTPAVLRDVFGVRATTERHPDGIIRVVYGAQPLADDGTADGDSTADGDGTADADTTVDGDGTVDADTTPGGDGRPAEGAVR
ncbi:hypothetical protein AB0H97_04045 [Streptomyces sp. NPDC050788]|uniref:hypothetical protein n=1 Tax=Streptomyces sp. NPDC050788 TaxID=3155041 RepID=UPI0034456D87